MSVVKFITVDGGSLAIVFIDGNHYLIPCAFNIHCDDWVVYQGMQAKMREQEIVWGWGWRLG